MSQQSADEGIDRTAADASKYLGRAGGLAAALALAAVLSSPATSWAEPTDSGSGDASSSGASASRDAGSGTDSSGDDSSSSDAGTDTGTDTEQDSSTSGEPPRSLLSDDDADEPDTDAEADVDEIAATDDLAEANQGGTPADEAASGQGTRNRSSRVFGSSALADPTGTGNDAQTTTGAEDPVAPVPAEEPAVTSVPAPASPAATTRESQAAQIAPEMVPQVNPEVATVALSQNLAPGTPGVPVPSPAPVVLYAGLRREGDQSRVGESAEASGAAAAVVAAAPTAPSRVARASAAAAGERVPLFGAFGQWLQRSFMAASPTFSPQSVSVSLAAGGSSGLFELGAVDADTDTLIYTLAGKASGTGSAAGTLDISGESAIYTPPAGWDGATGYADIFTVTASDDHGGFHIHGLAGLLHMLTFGMLGKDGHTATSTVTVNVVAAATPPQPEPEPPAPEPEPQPQPPTPEPEPQPQPEPEPEPSTPPAPPTSPQPPTSEPPATPSPSTPVADRAYWDLERGVGFSVGSLGALAGQARMEEALQEVEELGFTMIRTWGTDEYTGRILEAITRMDLGLKVQPGIWITQDAGSREQIDAALAIITPYSDKVVGVSLGNEQIVDWNTWSSLTVPEVIGQVQYFKSKSSLPVTYNFAGETFLPGASQWDQNLAGLVEALDYINVHSYGGFFDNRNNSAWTPALQLASVRSFETMLANKLASIGLGSKPIILGETGWQSTGYNPAVTNPANQQQYYELISRYVYGPDARFDGMYYFNFTDETWKGGDDNWGLFREGSATAIGSSKFTILPISQVLAGESPPPPAAPDPEPQEPEVPGPVGTFPVSFTNNTGAYGNDEIYVIALGQATPGQWSWVDRDGVAHRLDHSAANAPGHLSKDGVNYANMSFTLAEAAGFRIPPELLGGRIYVSLGEPLYIGIAPDNSGWVGPDPANPTDPNYDTVYDWYELSFKNGAVPFGGNTTQVDQFGLPFTFTLTQNSTGYSGTRGITLSRDEVFQRFENTMPAAFQALIIRDGSGDPLRILAPRSHQPGALATWYDAPVNSFWSKYAGEQFVYNGPGFSVTGAIVDGQFAYTVTSAAGASTSHTMIKPTTAEVWRADGPFVGTGLQGAFLAHLDAAFHRGVATSPQNWDNATAYYPAGGRWDNWSQFFHAISVGGFAYGFPYDDVNSQSSVLILNNSQPLTNLALTLGR